MRSPAELHRMLTSGGSLSLLQRLLVAILIPLGWMYGLAGKVRVFLYGCGLLKSCRPEVAVISVGNLAAGGTGKTPMVDYLVHRLQERGRRVAVVSRGYRGKVEGVALVNPDDRPWLGAETCGDEPLLLARRNPGVPVLVAPRRAAGVRKAAAELGVDTVVLDDAFQHLAVQRDLDIVLLDAGRPLGNGRVLPAGILREFPSALRRADLIVFTRSSSTTGETRYFDKPALRCRHRLADSVRSLEGDDVPMASLLGQRGVAFAGIADPENFFRALRERGLDLLDTVALADHAHYDDATLARLSRQTQKADFLVTTEKDGVKLPSGHFPIPCYQVPLTIEFPTTDLLDKALDSLNR